ncbi:MAG: DUF2721 domain-containing protein [Melioribacteraceae bacterium]|nr:DUF2721 domain-containing protein [Melioribacteraceae bacterium]MCF8355060.1 DUF2721 domain-containing protein [Melioribacteraceae bacterium]MCF8395643.1 DUF2721 domain-containing protein [Melioribacteraceae bacterium]MCF8420278.1 DUF2721 domain-containing protein [Melioribacteraceae bacterium]
MLAPAVMISACGLLLLGINNKYSLVVNRIRLLNQERRAFKKKISEDDFTTDDNVRFESIIRQIEFLTFRVKLVRNAVLSYAAAVGLYVVTSVMLGFAYFSSSKGFDVIIVAAFLIGMVCVLVGIIFTGLETAKGYEIVSYEIKADE